VGFSPRYNKQWEIQILHRQSGVLSEKFVETLENCSLSGRDDLL